MKKVQFWHLLLAGLLSLTLHAALLAAIPGIEISGAVSTGSGGLVVSFGPAGGASGGVPVTPAAAEERHPTEAEMVEVTEAPAAEIRPVDAVQEAVVSGAVPETMLPADVPAQTATEITPAPTPETVPKTVVAKSQAPPVPRDKPRPSSPVKVPEKQVRKPTEKVVETRQAEPTRPPQPKAQHAGSAGSAGFGNSTATGSSQSASAGGHAGTREDYFAVILAWLERHKKYPFRERSRNREGVVRLTFILHRNGGVSGAFVDRSSGFPGLDRAALAMLNRAAPLPAMPPEISEHQLQLTVPVEFSLVR